MVKKLLDVVNKYFKEVIIIDDSIYNLYAKGSEK